MAATTGTFSGKMPEFYDQFLGSAWFNPLADDLARRLPVDPDGDVLELACGTGLATRKVRQRIAAGRRLIATDISPVMMDYARQRLADADGIEWGLADAANLAQFEDARFGAVICAFGLMFVPDKATAMKEVRRVLKPGGLFLFNVWDQAKVNRHAMLFAEIMEKLFPGDAAMQFDVPYSMADRALLMRQLENSGFSQIQVEDLRMPVGPVSARALATGLICGTPRATLISERGVPLDQAIESLAEALARHGGADPYRGEVRYIAVQARAP